MLTMYREAIQVHQGYGQMRYWQIKYPLISIHKKSYILFVFIACLLFGMRILTTVHEIGRLVCKTSWYLANYLHSFF